MITFIVLFLLGAKPAHAWQFAVSGDSRNCGDLVMPLIADAVHKDGASFYWHLGDFRWGGKVDEDLAHDSSRAKPVTLEEYKTLAWKDFIDSQITPFGSTPVYLGIGNHEIGEHTREEFIPTFRRWLGKQKEPVQIYFHWVKGGVDFISLDNASVDQFDKAQMNWFKKIIAQDEADPKIKTLVVGMHEALPDSISYTHSMSQSGQSVPIDSGREVYAKLLHVRDQAKKNVYVLASHSHFFMDGTFNTPYWREHGGVLPGWIIGTAGAVRYALPKDAGNANKAETKVYGYLLATVQTDGKIRFDFKKIVKSDVPAKIASRYGAELVDYCWDQNAIDKMP